MQFSSLDNKRKEEESEIIRGTKTMRSKGEEERKKARRYYRLFLL
jgi:hypothetical protein